MEFFGINLSETFNNPLTAVITGGSGVAVFYIYKTINTILNPTKYIDKFYDLGDKVIETLDNRLIDKIRNEKVKADIQKKIKVVLLQRNIKIQRLIKRISD